MCTVYKRLFALSIALLALVGTLGFRVGTADALNPPATNPDQVTYYLSGGAAGSINNYWAALFRSWGRSYVQPTVHWYQKPGVVGDYWACSGQTWTGWMNDNGFYCAAERRIYMDYEFMQRMLQSRGDYYVGAFLAHEWGHHIDMLLGYGNRAGDYHWEYHADCLAGMYTRYGYSTGRLVDWNADYGEGFNWLYYQQNSASHGLGPSRAAWYRYGYVTQNINECYWAFSASL